MTDAALVPEVGRFAPPARAGFQVHFVERAADMMAIGGRLLADAGPNADVMVIDVAVMDGDWRQEVRAAVIERVLAATADACGLAEPPPGWWVKFRVIDEGSWGSRGGVLSVLTLLDTGVFTDEKAAAIRAALGA
ncbi:tautomerase enzyme [Streptomyces sp. NPDC102395]|uniref:tautomerase enzyme n=1 Tax=Streptomyces sp. NPDC102395 TaxID=3366168 RepID=UPI003830C4C3